MPVLVSVPCLSPIWSAQLNKVEVTAFQSFQGKRTNPQLLLGPVGFNSVQDPLKIHYDLPRILFQEEEDTYSTSLHASQQLASRYFNKLNFLKKVVVFCQPCCSALQQQAITMHHSSVYSKALVGIIDKICGPLVQELDRRQRLVEAEV